MDPGAPELEWDRRTFLRLVGATGAVAWAVPTIITLDAAPAAASPIPWVYPGLGKAHVVCNGSGGFRIDFGPWENAPSALKECIQQHEQCHIDDLLARYPGGCPGSNGSAHPNELTTEYGDWLYSSECHCFGVEKACVMAKLSQQPPLSADIIALLQRRLLDINRAMSVYC